MGPLPPTDLSAAKALTIQVQIARRSDTDAAVLAQVLTERLTAVHPHVLAVAPDAFVDTRAQVIATVHLQVSSDRSGQAPSAGPGDAQTTASVHVTDLFGVDIARRTTSYPTALGPGPRHLARLLEACSDEELDAYLRRPEEERAREAFAKADAVAQRFKEDAQRARDDEDRLWREGHLAADCQPPTRAWACQQLESFVRRRTDSPHIEQARHVLALARPTLERLREQQSWELASMACRRPETTSDCDGLEQYLADYPGGPHVREARRLLVRIRPAMRRLREAERTTDGAR